MLMYYNECITRLVVYWKLNLLLSWAELALTSFCHTLFFLMVVTLFEWLCLAPCPSVSFLPQRF